MEYDTINNLAKSIDNVYAYTSEDGSRKTVTKLSGDDCMTISFRTILNISRNDDLHMQMAYLKKEANDMISSRLRTIKADFKSSAGRTLNTKKSGESDNVETLTVSPYSPHRKVKYTCTYTYEVK